MKPTTREETYQRSHLLRPRWGKRHSNAMTKSARLARWFWKRERAKLLRREAKENS